jgi:hypothetical protein
MLTDKMFLTGCLENENVEGDINVDAAPINAEDEKHMFRFQWPTSVLTALYRLFLRVVLI